MENFSIKNILAVYLATGMLMSSCSRQIASTASVNKMLNNEQLVNVKTPASNQIAQGLTKIALVNSSNEECTALPNVKANKIVKGMEFIRGPKRLIKSLPAEIAHKIQNPTAFVKSMTKNHDIASYSGNQHTEGMLGIAGLFLIAAIAMAVFGITNMGVVFWEIAAVLFIAAIVFFILYLVAKAAGPSTP